MKNIVIQLTVTDAADVEEIRGLLAQQATMSRAEPGCVKFDVLQSQSEPTVFFLLEQWESAEAHEVHRTAAAYLEIYQPKVLPKASRVAHVSDVVA
ncbi:antibiotic biosynthesis monooxygenase [bacterium]|nr:antibiotic biosynthesis monooxygenase [bacterium]